MTPPLATRAPHTRRMALMLYAIDTMTPVTLPEDDRRWAAITTRLRDRTWSPSAQDCPVEWGTVEAWYAGVNKATRRVIEGYKGE